VVLGSLIAYSSLIVIVLGEEIVSDFIVRGTNKIVGG
jgi:hypothetical protein